MIIKADRIRKNMQAISVAIACVQVLFCSALYSIPIEADGIVRLLKVLEKVIRVYWS